MRLCLSLVLFLAGTSGTAPLTAASLPLGAAVIAGAAGALPEPRDGSHDMDFGNGKWRTEITIYKEPFTEHGPVVTMAGTKVATALWGGKAWLEEIEADGDGVHWEAANLFTYDPKARQWVNYYVDSKVGRFDPPHFGELRDGSLEFTWQDLVGGRTILIRGAFKDFMPDSHVYEVSRSADGGRTWHPSFIARVFRVRQ